MMRLLQCLSLADSSDNPRLSCGLVLLLILVVIMGVPHLSWAARWYEDYERAVALIDEGGCSREALQLLGAAVVDKPRPRLNARTIAVQTIDYLPYYQLARAHLACGDLDSCRHYLEVSRDHGVAPAELLTALEQLVARTETDAARGAEPRVDTGALAMEIRAVNDTIRQSRLLAGSIEGRRQEDWVRALLASQSAEIQRAADDLKTAEEQLADGTLRRDPELIESAAVSASSALKTYSDIEAQINAQAPPTPPTSTPVIRPSATVPIAPPTAITIVSRAIATPRIDPPPGESPVAEPTYPAVSSALRRAAAAYIRASYDEVIENLRPEDLPLAREQAAAHLLRAAAHHALYCLTGRSDEVVLERALQDIAACQKIDVSLRPDPRLFSPEFMALFNDL